MSNDKLTPAAHEAICKAFEKGYSKTVAASWAGVCRQSVSIWLDRGEAGDERYEKLFKDAQDAKAKRQIILHDIIAKMPDAPTPMDWQKAKWLLETGSPKDYSLTHFNTPVKIHKTKDGVDLNKTFKETLEGFAAGKYSTVQVLAMSKLLETGCKIHEDTEGRKELEALKAWVTESSTEKTAATDKAIND